MCSPFLASAQLIIWNEDIPLPGNQTNQDLFKIRYNYVVDAVFSVIGQADKFEKV